MSASRGCAAHARSAKSHRGTNAQPSPSPIIEGGKPRIGCRRSRSDAIVRLAQGERVAYLSDAGTPAVSDPGAVLAHQARSAGHRVLPLPGPSFAKRSTACPRAESCRARCA